MKADDVSPDGHHDSGCTAGLAAPAVAGQVDRQVRRHFEGWARTRGFSVEKNKRQAYVYTNAGLAFAAWCAATAQASRAASGDVEQQPEPAAQQRAVIDEARRKDAERYRWLRGNCECMGTDPDRAIDAQMALEEDPSMPPNAELTR